MGGPTGLDYNILYRDLDQLGLEPARYEQLREEVRLIEIAALHEMNRKED